MTSNDTEMNAIADDSPTVRLEALTDAEIAAMEAQEQLEAEAARQQAEAAELTALHDDLDEPSPAAGAALNDSVEIGASHSEIADELREARVRNAEMTASLSRRDKEIAALKATGAAEAPTGDSVTGDFEPGETRKLVRRDAGGSHEFALRPGQMSLGSATDNDIRIDDAFVSVHHAQIVSSARETVLKDMNSTNGTYVNSRKIASCALRDGDSITVGRLSFTFVRRRETAPAIGPVAARTAPEHGADPVRGSWR